MKKTTITINGRLYDAITGMPVQQPTSAPAQAKPSHSQPQTKPQQKAFTDISRRQNAAPRPVAPRREHTATSVHQRPQRSETLNRQALTRPEPPKPAAEEAKRSPMISRFAPAAIETQPPPQAPTTEPETQPPTPPQTAPIHPHVIKALQQRASATTPAHQTSKELKEMLIKERLAQVSTEPKAPKKSWFARKPKLASILASSLSLLILAGYFSYVNLTNISMRVAANRAGIHASFPNYKPSGYSLNGPITYAPGEVTINYKSNTNDNGFSLTQKASEWDSQGVLDNYVRKQSGNYLTIQERGITVYTFNNKAAWVNGGLLHVIDGNTTLSSDQILRIATSL